MCFVIVLFNMNLDPVFWPITVSLTSLYTEAKYLSVADPGCLSRILILPIPDPGSRIPDPKTATKERGEKKFVITFYVATNFTKLQIILVLKC
jgi:hypothetical protein